jgi:hypothetical protein
MQPDNLQQNMSNEMSSEDIRAALGFSNTLLTGMMPVDATPEQQEPQGGENGQDMGDSDNMDIEAQDKEDRGEDKTDEKMEILRTELKDTIKVEIDSIKQMIKEALSEENGEN